jgi:hypothetical protein
MDLTTYLDPFALWTTLDAFDILDSHLTLDGFDILSKFHCTLETLSTTTDCIRGALGTLLRTLFYLACPRVRWSTMRTTWTSLTLGWQGREPTTCSGIPCLLVPFHELPTCGLLHTFGGPIVDEVHPGYTLPICHRIFWPYV